MSKPNEKPQNHLNIELPEDVGGGQYSNLSIITHSPSEFIVDFIQLMPGVPKGKVKTRIIMTPDNANTLMKIRTNTWSNKRSRTNGYGSANEFWRADK